MTPVPSEPTFDRRCHLTPDPLVLVIGLGSIGSRHARNFKSLGVARVIGVDPDPLRRQQFLERIGGESVDALDRALAMAPTLAVVASPSSLHVEQATACAEANCHLFVEKPLGTSIDGISRLIATVRERGLFAHVGSNFKFHPGFERLRRRIETGGLGRITGVQVLVGQWLPDWHPYEDYRRGYSARHDLGGGIALDMHELDYLTWLLGPIRASRGFSMRSGCLEIDTEDVVCTCLLFEGGILGTLHADYIQRSYRRRYHISGDLGTIEWDFASATVTSYDARTGTTTQESVAEDANEMYVRQTGHVLEGVAGRENPVTPLEHAFEALRLQLELRSSRVTLDPSHR